MLKKCKKCYGYGWWPLGMLSPIGPIDASEMIGFVTKCPWCDGGDVRDGRYLKLKEMKENEDG